MRMNILPGSLWLAYTITSPSNVQSLLPASLKLSSCALLQDEASAFPAPKILFNIYTVDAGLAMQGVRADVLTLAQHRRERTMHLVMLECFTNTLHWNPVEGVSKANAYCVQGYKAGERAIWTVRTKRDVLSVDAVPTTTKELDWTFAVEANLACYFQNVDRAYTMDFDEEQIMRPVRALRPSRPIVNTFWREHRSKAPSHIFFHERPMAFDVHVRI